MSDDKPKALPEELFQVHKALLDDGWLLWKKHRALNEPPVGPVAFSRLSIVTFSQMAAVTAVDVGLTEEQFLETCRANYKEASAKAVRWG